MKKERKGNYKVESEYINNKDSFLKRGFQYTQSWNNLHQKHKR